MKVKQHGERPISTCISPSTVTFHSQIDENESKSKSTWNPDWTIQKEVSITIDKSANESTGICRRKTRILVGIIIVIGFILLIIIPILVLIIIRNSNQQTEMSQTTKTFGKKMFSCENLQLNSNVIIDDFIVIAKNTVKWSDCCSWCLSVVSCHSFYFQNNSSICYLTNSNQTFYQQYQITTFK